MNRKGQLSIVNMIFFVFIVGIAVVITPVINSFINDAISTNNITGISATIMQSIVPIFWLGIIVTFFIYISPISVRQF